MGQLLHQLTLHELESCELGAGKLEHGSWNSTKWNFSSVGQSNGLICQTHMLDTKAVGAQTELQCITYLHGLGYNISIPWGDNARYDFVLDVNNKLYKIQVKTARIKSEGVYVISTKSTSMNRSGNKIKHYTKDDIDYFATFIKNQCYLIPFKETSRSEKTLRFLPPQNNQIKNITFAQNYLAEEQLKLIEH